jgi:hypothetical protein
VLREEADLKLDVKKQKQKQKNQKTKNKQKQQREKTFKILDFHNFDHFLLK